jgi:peroxiredoxin family protein
MTTIEAPVPTFDDESSSSGRKLCIICSKGSLDMAYPGLLIGNTALAEDVEVHLFFSFWGYDIIKKDTMGKLQFSAVGNPATHMPTALMGLPGMQSFATRMMRKQMAAIDVPEVPEFLEMITDAGGHLWACKMTADMQHLTTDDLYDRVEGIINVSDFLELSEGAQLLFI